MLITPAISALIDRALEEDRAFRDVTTFALVPPEQTGVAFIRSKAEGVLAGVDVALAAFARIDPTVRTEALLRDGAKLEPGTGIVSARGSLASLLRAERTALNFLQRMSGIASETAKYVAAVSGTKAAIVDTRKTAPGLRELDKYSVRAGGGRNHRIDLSDGILVKDNHLEALRAGGMSLKEVVALALKRAPHTLRVEVEVTTVEEAREAAEAGAHIIMLDNMSLETMREAVNAIAGRALVEASGGVRLEAVREIAETGVDLISVGALTHSAKALDISMDVEPLAAAKWGQTEGARQRQM